MQKLSVAIVAALVLLVIIGLSLPRHLHVEVSKSIDANPATVFALINDFERARLWSPLLDADPNARVAYSGPARGVGAVMTWDGAIVGSGAQMITESRPFERVAIVTNPGEPGETRSWFDIRRGAAGSDITWRFESDAGYNIIGRAVALMVGGIFRRDFDKGLSRLKDVAESLPRADFSSIEIEHIVVEAADIAYLTTTTSLDPTAVSDAMGDAYFAILNFIDRHNLAEAGAPMSIKRAYSGANLVFDAAIPVRGTDEGAQIDDPRVKLGKTYSGAVIRVKHMGSYRRLGDTHARITSYLAALGIERNGDAWESYVSDPTRVAEADLVTYIYCPVLQ